MSPHTHGRRIVLIGLITAVAALVFASTALAAPTITLNSAPAGIAPNVIFSPLFQTTSRGSGFNFTVTGTGNVSATCTFDGGAPTACGPSGASPQTYSYTANGSPLDLGSHEVIITASDGNPGTTTAKYTWRVEPVVYGPHILSHNNGSDRLEAYFPLDDPVSVTQDVADLGPNGFVGHYYNYALPKQRALTACEDQPHPPFACTLSGASLLANKGWSFYFGGNPDDNGGLQSDDSIDWHDDNFASSDWTVEMWAKPSSIGGVQGLYSHDANMWMDNSGFVNCAQFGDDYGDTSQVAKSDSPLVANTKYYIACSRTSGGTVTLYIDGIAQLHTASTTHSPSNIHDPQGKIGLVNSPTYSNWHGYIDDVADYYSALPAGELKYHWELGAVDNGWYATRPGVTADRAPPSEEPATGGTSIASPQNNSQFSPDAQAFKAPTAQFTCWDPQSGGAPLTSGLQTQIPAGPGCSATLDGNPILNGAALDLTPGTHTFTLTATDATGNVWVHTHTYFVTPAGAGYFNVILCTNPLVSSPGCDAPIAYYRLNEAAGAGTIVDSSGNGYNGDYKNDQDNSGNTGVSGDGNGTRSFFGEGGYAAVNNIDAPLYGYTLEGWWKPDDNGGMAIMQHGSNGTIWYDGTNVNFRPDERSSVVASVPLAVPASPTSWYYVAGVYNGVTATLYVRESQGSFLTLTASTPVAFHGKDGAGSADTFYLGFANDIPGVTSPWLRGQLDEVAYYGTALSQTKLTQHFNADPPAGDVRYAKQAASGDSKPPAVTDNKKPSAHKPSKLAVAKAKAKAATKALAKSKAKLRVLKAHHASKKAIHRAQVDVKVKTKALAKAKARVRALTRH